jgi:quinoprotein glucose dehydrogenase
MTRAARMWLGCVWLPCAWLLCVWLASCSTTRLSPTDWPTYLHDPGGTRYSPLTQIDVNNVTRLQVAWTYHMRPPSAPRTDTQAESVNVPAGRGNGRFAPSEASPLIINGTMYLPTPYGRVVALNAQTGREIWKYDLPHRDQPATRGVEYWPGSKGLPPRILFGTRGGRLIALLAATGQPVQGFGQGGVVDLKTPAVMNGLAAAPLGMSSPPLVYEDLVITGSRVQEMPALGAAGDVRAWDVRTGKLLWTFHSVPRPGETGHDTWRGDSWRNRSGVNVWSFMVLDRQRAILYLPFGAPTFDRWGADRPGSNLFANAIVAVDARSGRYLWHFQTVHHDIWDLDLPTATLLDVRRNGASVPAIAVMNKSSLLFILDRVSGRPLYDVREVPVPTDTDIPGESAWPTQPMPVSPPPLARQSFDLSELADLTPEHRAFCARLIQEKHIVGSRPFQPLRADSAVASFPGSLGGADWGGAAFDPRLGYYIVNTNDLASPEQLAPRRDGFWGLKEGYVYFWDPVSRLPCQRPPWGSLYAVNVNTGRIAWRSTLGVSDSLPPAVSKTGRPSAGGPIVTAGGLTFIAGTDDRRLRAFASRSGEELWTYMLPASTYGTPVTYGGNDHRQYVVVVNTGGFAGAPIENDAVIAFALPGNGPQLPEQHASAYTPGISKDDQPTATPTELMQRSCLACHDLQTITSKRKSADEWAETVERMAIRGASVTPEEIRVIADYLTRSYPASATEHP